MAVAVTANLDQLKRGKGTARLVVFGDTDLADNQYIDNFFNRDFLMNSVDWLAGQTNAITIRPKTLRASRFNLTVQEFDLVFVLSVLLIPELLLLIGLAVWWERRNYGRAAMPLRNTIIVVVLLLLVGGYAVYLRQQPAPEATPKLYKIDAKDIVKIELHSPDRDLVLERTKDNGWKFVKPITADAERDAVNEIANDIAGLQIIGTAEDQPSDLAPFGLAVPAVIVTVTTKDQKSPAVNHGRQTGPDRQFRLHQASRPAGGPAGRQRVRRRRSTSRSTICARAASSSSSRRRRAKSLSRMARKPFELERYGR